MTTTRRGSNDQGVAYRVARGTASAMSSTVRGTLTGMWRVQEANWTAWTRSMTLMLNTTGRLLGQPGREVLPADKRFEDDAWNQNLAFDFLKQAYLITAQWMKDLADGWEPVDPSLHKQASFWTAQVTDALSPTNYPWTNPAVIEETLRTGGTNLLRGWQNLLQDMREGRLTMVPKDSFVVGEDLAITPGKVVYHNPLIELIQYTPTTERVAAVPMLMVPPWINKYYVMDMRPENSMYRYLVDSGHTLFGISWKNPDQSVLDMTWDDYMELGPLAALRVVGEITGTDKVNMAGYCLGGIMLQTTLAYLAATQQEQTATLPAVNSATFFTTHQDFNDAGDIVVFLSEPWIQVVEWIMEASGGYLDGRNMATTFNMLRANDLLWPYVINNYLLGKQPEAFDLLFWNSDGTRVPGRIHSYLLREFFQKNKLKEPNGLTIKGASIDLRKITTPSYTVAGTTDHIVPWKGAFTMPSLVGGPVRLVLSKGGHIAGIIAPPTKQRAAYWTNEHAHGVDPEAWLASAAKHEGSWWPDWRAWLAQRSGEHVEPPSTGSDAYPPIMDAPGTYVLET